MTRSTPMDHESADRINAASQRDPDSPTAASRFQDRAQQVADANEPRPEPELDEDGYEYDGH